MRAVIDPAIRVESLSKRYRIGTMQSINNTLRDQLADVLMATMRRFRNSKSEPQTSEQSTIWALKDISFDVGRGEVVGIIGRNGAGKSTLLKILSRITEPTGGQAEVHGRLSSLLEVGTGFHPELTGRENTYLNGAILGMRKAEIDQKFDEIVDFAEVEKFIDTPVKRYSSGMQVRLAFAVAAHLEPEILLVDEVLAVGDVAFQRKCLGKMRDVAGEGRTVLFVSHNMTSIARLCQRVLLLESGQISMDDQTEKVIQHYLATGDTTDSHVVWPDPEQAPGDKMVRLHSVRVLQEGAEGPTEYVDVSKEVLIEISYWNREENSSLYTGIVLLDKMETPVLQSTNSPILSLTEDEWHGRPRPRGLFRSVCRIPADFLNEGRYTICIIMGTTIPSEPGMFQQTVYGDRVVSFDAIVMDDPNKSSYSSCLVRPRLAWQTEYVGQK